MSALVFLCIAAAAVDGDTLRCRNIQDAGGRVRIARIDAPEMGEPNGPASKAGLAAMLKGPVRCEQIDAFPWTKAFETHDRYGRIVARCSVNGRDLGRAMINAGLAEVWPK